jgi:FixJ family two-component response regulator
MSRLPVVFAIDDDAVWRRAIQRLLSGRHFEVRVFGTAADFLAVHDPQAAGCILLDFALPEMDGLELQECLLARGCRLPIIFVSGRADVLTSVCAMRAGALNFLTKPVRESQLLHALDEALEIDAAQRRLSSARSTRARRLARLTPRERQVLDYVVAGRMNKQIAADLGTVEQTVKVHRARVMRKLGVRSLAELVRLTAAAEVPMGTTGLMASPASRVTPGCSSAQSGHPPWEGARS